MTLSDAFFREWEWEPPSGVYPTLSDYETALATLQREDAGRVLAVRDEPVAFNFGSVEVERGFLNRSTSATWRNR